MLYAVKGVGTAPADDVRTHVILYALYAYYFYRRRQEKAVYMAIHVTCTTTSQSIIGQMMVNELAEPVLAPNGWRPPASRTPANNGVPAVGVFAPYGAVSSGGITAFVPD